MVICWCTYSLLFNISFWTLFDLADMWNVGMQHSHWITRSKEILLFTVPLKVRSRFSSLNCRCANISCGVHGKWTWRRNAWNRLYSGNRTRVTSELQELESIGIEAYFGDLISAMTKIGYQATENLWGASFDWRFSPGLHSIEIEFIF